MPLGLGFAIVVADDGCDDAAVAAIKTGDVAIEGEVFTMLMVSAMADAMADVMQERACFEQNARLRGEVMDGLQLVKKHHTERANVLGVLLVVFEAPAKAARGEEHLASFSIVAMRLLTGESFVGNFLKEPFAKTHAGDDETANIQVTAHGEKNDRRDPHHVGAITANTVGFHAFAHIPLDNVRQAFPQERNLQRGQSFAARPGSNVG